jgi:hypothetical protein
MKPGRGQRLALDVGTAGNQRSPGSWLVRDHCVRCGAPGALANTDAAGLRLADIVARGQLPDEAALRLVCEGRRLAVRLDPERPGDTSSGHTG